VNKTARTIVTVIMAATTTAVDTPTKTLFGFDDLRWKELD
jgi:hypothetical protein